MKLIQNTALFGEIVEQTSRNVGLEPPYIEKDYWVTKALYEVFRQPVGADTVFKGGTALQKGNGLIERFSEDVDLVVLPRAGDSDNKMKGKLKAITQAVSDLMPEVATQGITNKVGMVRKTAHEYPRLFEGALGQVRDLVIIEATWLGNSEPYTMGIVQSFMGAYMQKMNLQEEIAEYEMSPFSVRLLEPTRTFCEKIMSLVRFSYSENPLSSLSDKIRHTYDLHMMLQQEQFQQFLASPSFEQMLLRVEHDDVTSFRNNNAWLNHHPTQAYFFAELDLVWQTLSRTYTRNFQNLVYGEFPKASAVLGSLVQIRERLLSVGWTVKVGV